MVFVLNTPEAGRTGEDLGWVSRATDVYGVHSYHTKVPPQGIEPFIAAHTAAGEVVLDPFCGSGMTGVAARRLGRRGILSDLSPAAVHIAANYTTPADPLQFVAAAERVAARTEPERTGLYACTCHQCGSDAVVGYLVWSDVRQCAGCSAALRVWDDRDNLQQLHCTQCGREQPRISARLLGESPVRTHLDCVHCGRVQRDATDADVAAALVDRGAIPHWTPRVPFGPDREMWRMGHSELGINEVADFYSARNLRAMAALWAAIAEEPDARIRGMLRFTFTAMANRASRRYQWNARRPTNVLGGTLYVSSLRYEFNVFGLWSRKLAAVRRFLEATHGQPRLVETMLASATALPLRDGSVDYCFTDPPFGANIIYSDCSILWEAWLGRLTSRDSEAVVNKHRKPADGGKGIAEYGELMLRSFREINRVLKDGAAATVVFQSTHPDVWQAVMEAVVEAGFAVESADTLHKGQPSFKGVKGLQKSERVAASDVILTLRPQRSASRRPAAVHADLEPVWQRVRQELSEARPDQERLRTTGHLYSVAVAAALQCGIPVGEVTFAGVQQWLSANCVLNAERWHLADWRMSFDALYGAPSAEVPLNQSSPKAAPNQVATTVRGAKNTPVYLAHSYPTKIPPEAIVPYIEHFTRPGEVVCDPFAGSGMTGVAARRAGRHAILSDLSPLAVHLAHNVTTPCDPERLVAEADRVLQSAAEDLARWYATRCTACGGPARIEWTVWGSTVACPGCAAPLRLWDVAFDAKRGVMRDGSIRCPHCRAQFTRRGARVIESAPVWSNVLCLEERRRFERPPLHEDAALSARLDVEPVNHWFPDVPMQRDREMYIRSALELHGVQSLADFYTRRNLMALARLWAAIEEVGDLRLRQALAFAFTSAAWHGTRMRRFNARGGQRPLTGTLYIPQMSVEVNVASVFRHKVDQLARYMAREPAASTAVQARLASATQLDHVATASVDYVFTDPPFGSNIFYADCAFIAESWLGRLTDTRAEAVINRSLSQAAGGKSAEDYTNLMRVAMAEIARIIKPSAAVTVVFQSTDETVWAALESAIEDADLRCANAATLDKSQLSHKGYKGASGREDVANFDMVLTLRRRPHRSRRKRDADGGVQNAVSVLSSHLAALPSPGASVEADRQRTLPYLHAVLLRAHFNGDIGLLDRGYAVVRDICAQSFDVDPAGRWILRARPAEAQPACPD